LVSFNQEDIVMARGDRDLVKEQFWRGILRQWDSRKQKVRDFCAEHGVSEANFYAWRRTIAERDRQAASRPVRAMLTTEDRPTFVPLQVVAGTPTPAILEVVVGPNRVVRVPLAFDAVSLRRLLTVLEEGTPC
jgi:transposase-like protein